MLILVVCPCLLSRKPNCSTSPVEFAFFTEMCQLLGVLNGNNITPSMFTLLHQLLESILHYDIYQVHLCAICYSKIDSIYGNRIKEMVSFELSKEIEKDVFILL